MKKLASIFMPWAIAALVVLLTVGVIEQAMSYSKPPSDVFSNPQRVEIIGYSDHAMEPFISPYGRYMFWNNLNRSAAHPNVNTNLYWAERVGTNNALFQYRGQVQNTDTGGLEGVPTMAENGRFYFTNSAMVRGNSTIVAGDFADGTVTNLAIVPGDFPVRRPGCYTLGPEVNRRNTNLYFVQVCGKGASKTMNLRMAERVGDGFRLAVVDLFRNVNSDNLDYAPAVSEDELELYFTRKKPWQPPVIMLATRSSIDLPFGLPKEIEAIKGFVEGPTILGDRLYYHKKVGGRFVIENVERNMR